MLEEQLLEAEARRRGLSVTQLRMLKAVPDDLIRQIVADNRRGVAERSSPVAPAKEAPVQRGSGWAEPTPLSPPPGVALIDRIAEAFDRRERAERRR